LKIVRCLLVLGFILFVGVYNSIKDIIKYP